MRIFSLDCSFSFFNFSVVEEGKLVLLHYEDTSKKTLQNLPALFVKEGIKLEGFDAFAVSVGVGYLTSLRIGVTFMKTVAYLLGKPIVPYENLLLLGRFMRILPCRIPYLRVSSNLFYRVFDGEEATEVRLHKGEKLKGVGITLRGMESEGITSETLTLPFFPFSAYGALYAYEFLREKPEGVDPFSVEPLYIKPPV